MLHDLSLLFLVAFLVVAFLLGLMLTTAALALEELNFRRHTSGREVARMLAYAVVENFGYRQLNDVWRIMGFVDLLRQRQGWGAHVRKGIGQVAES